MRKNLLLLAALAGGAFLLGKRSAQPAEQDRKYTLYQRAALLWTSPTGVKTRRSVRKQTKKLRDRLPN